MMWRTRRRRCQKSTSNLGLAIIPGRQVRNTKKAKSFIIFKKESLRLTGGPSSPLRPLEEEGGKGKSVYIVKNKWRDNTGGYMTSLKVAW